MRPSAPIARRPVRFVPLLEQLETRLAPATTFSIADGSVIEPAPGGTVNLDFTVTRTGDLTSQVTLGYTTVAGTAQPNTDFTPTTGTVLFPTGAATETIAIPVFGNGVYNNPSLTFSVQLTGIVNVVGPPVTLSDRTDFTVGAVSVSVAVGDFNGDGKPDLAVAVESSNTVEVLLNTTAPGASTPSFAPAVGFAVGSNPYSVAVADINGDGKPDLVVANRSSNTASVLLNTTAPGAAVPSFAPAVDFTVGAGAYSLALGDINGDGRPDIVVTSAQSNTVSVLLNTTAPGAALPSFAPKVDFSVGANPRFVAVGDLNGDGRPDLVVSNRDSDTVSVLMNTTAPGAAVPSFAPAVDFAAGSQPRPVALGDLNRDGRLDLVVGDEGTETVSVLINTTAPGAAAPSFAPAVEFATNGLVPRSVAVADLNGDGKLDLLVADIGSALLSVLVNTTAPGASSPSFVLQAGFAANLEPNSLAIADFNGDGRPDIAVANGLSTAMSVFLNTTVLGSATITANFPQTAVGTIIESQLSPNQHFVAALYRNELGRAGDLSNPQDAGAFVNALDQGTLTQAAVAAAVEHSFEARDFLVKGWYVTFLGRQANGTEELGWVNLLVQGQTEEAVLAEILGDPGHEFYNRTQTLASTGDPTQNYMVGLYQLLLGRTGSDAEKAARVDVLPELSLQGVALEIELSPEYRTERGRGLLRRPAAPAGGRGGLERLGLLQLGSVQHPRGHRIRAGVLLQRVSGCGLPRPGRSLRPAQRAVQKGVHLALKLGETRLAVRFVGRRAAPRPAHCDTRPPRSRPPSPAAPLRPNAGTPRRPPGASGRP